MDGDWTKMLSFIQKLSCYLPQKRYFSTNRLMDADGNAIGNGNLSTISLLRTLEIWDNFDTKKQDSWGQHRAHLGLTGPRWAPCWPHDFCYLGSYHGTAVTRIISWYCTQYCSCRIELQSYLEFSSYRWVVGIFLENCWWFEWEYTVSLYFLWFPWACEFIMNRDRTKISLFTQRPNCHLPQQKYGIPKLVPNQMTMAWLDSEAYFLHENIWILKSFSNIVRCWHVTAIRRIITWYYTQHRCGKSRTWAHFMSIFFSAIKILCKLFFSCFALTSILTKWSLQNVAHGMTSVL